MRVVVFGNCQAQLLESLIETACPGTTIDKVPPVFVLTDADQDLIGSKLQSADVIFAQRISDDYHLGWARTREIKATYGEKVVSWPNIYFDGYFPDVRYLYLGGWNKVQSPLEDYHLDSVIACFKA
jgi:hypothetical protein